MTLRNLVLSLALLSSWMARPAISTELDNVGGFGREVVLLCEDRTTSSGTCSVLNLAGRNVRETRYQVHESGASCDAWTVTIQWRDHASGDWHDLVTMQLSDPPVATDASGHVQKSGASQFIRATFTTSGTCELDVTAELEEF